VTFGYGEFALTGPGGVAVIDVMLGRLRRTTRLDVGLALTFVGLSYLVWVLVAGVARVVVQEMINSTTGAELPRFTRAVKIFFVDAGFVIDLVGLAWMTVSLILVAVSSRQKISISWSWVSATSQSFVAAIGAVVVGWAAYQPHMMKNVPVIQTGWEKVSFISLGVLTPIAILVWVTFLIWLLVERARLSRRGPTLTDGLRSNIFR